jgi:hypothetical protein
VAAAASRLFAVCSGSLEPNERYLFSMWANKTMSDVVALGAISRSAPEFSSISASPAADIAYFKSSDPMEGCIGSVTTTSIDPCAIAVRELPDLGTATVLDLHPTEDGALLFVSVIGNIGGTVKLYAIDLASESSRYVTSDVKAFAPCPDNAVIIQRVSTIMAPERYAGGVHTDLRLVNGGLRYLACALQPQ